MALNKEKVMEAARKLVDKGQVDKAIKEYLRIVAEDPSDVRVWLKVGDLYAKKGARQEAGETYLRVARHYQEQGFGAKAIAVYKQILKLEPRLVEVNLKLAELYRAEGALAEAMQHFESVAAHFHREGKTREALATVRQLVDLDPDNVATRIKLAELYSKESMNAEAVAEFAVACDQLRKQGRVDDFVKVAERLLWHKADNVALCRELAVLYLRRDDPRRALQKLQVCFKADSRDIETLALLAQAFQGLDQQTKTVSVLKELARVFDENKQRDKAEEVHRKILQFVPGDPDSQAYLGLGAPRPEAAPAPAAPPPSPVAALAAAAAAAPRSKLSLTTDMPAVAAEPPRMTGSFPVVDPAFELPDEEAGDYGGISDDLAIDDVAYEPAPSPGAEQHADEIASILRETDVYIKYGLHQKAVDHLRRVFALDADNLEARERLKDVLFAQGREAEAIDELLRLAHAVARYDVERTEGYLRELLAVDGTHVGALDLAQRLRIDLTAEPAGDDDGDLHGGGVVPLDDELDLDAAYGGPEPATRAEPFAGGDPRVGAARAGRDGMFAEPTRQVAPSEVEALAAMSGAPRALQFDDGVVEVPRGGRPVPRSLDDVLDEQLDDSLGDELDREVADELSGQADLRALARGALDGAGSRRVRSALDAEPDEFFEDLPFDPEEARAFDAQLDGRDASAADLAPRAPVDDGGDDEFARAIDADDVDAAARPATAHDLELPAYDDDELVAVPTAAARIDGGFAASPSDTTAVPATVRPERAPAVALEDALDEVDGYLAADMVVEASDALRALMARFPGHPLLAAKQRDLDAQLGGYVADELARGASTDAAPASEPPIAVNPRDTPAGLATADEAAAGTPFGLDRGTATLDDATASAVDDGALGDFEDERTPAGPSEVEPAEEPGYDHDDHAAADELGLDAEADDGAAARPYGVADAEPLSDAGTYDGDGDRDDDRDGDRDDAAFAGGADAGPDDGGDGDIDAGAADLDDDDLEELDAEDLESDVEELDALDDALDDGGGDVVGAATAPERVAPPSRPSVVLQAPVSDDDSDTHYELGLAFKEMGLLDEAVKALAKVRDTSPRAVQAQLVIGLCRREQGKHGEAIKAFKVALHAPQVTEREKIGLLYELGVAYEASGDPREAVYYVEQVVRRDPGYLDAGAVLVRLRAG